MSSASAVGDRHRDDDQDKGILYCLQKIRVVQNIGIIIPSHAQHGLRGGVIALFKGIDQHVHQRVNHKYAEKSKRRQKVQPRLCLPQSG